MRRGLGSRRARGDGTASTRVAPEGHGRAGCDNERVKFALIAALIALVVALLALTISNEGCLPWQERVGYGGGPFSEEEGFSRCDGSWFPFGSLPLVIRS